MIWRNKSGVGRVVGYVCNQGFVEASAGYRQLSGTGDPIKQLARHLSKSIELEVKRIIVVLVRVGK